MQRDLKKQNQKLQGQRKIHILVDGWPACVPDQKAPNMINALTISLPLCEGVSASTHRQRSTILILGWTRRNWLRRLLPGFPEWHFFNPTQELSYVLVMEILDCLYCPLS